MVRGRTALCDGVVRDTDFDLLELGIVVCFKLVFRSRLTRSLSRMLKTLYCAIPSWQGLGLVATLLFWLVQEAILSLYVSI